MTSVSGTLEAFEAEHGVTVIAARDVGSRAWNLADANSDRDVAVLFVQDPLEYATLDGYLDSGRLRTDGRDCQGWNVRRFAELLGESNPTAFEFLHSPRRYRECGALSRIEGDVGDSFVPIALYHHYRSLAERQYRKYLQGRLLVDGELAYLVLEEHDGALLVEPADSSEGARSPRTVDADAYERGRTDRTVKRHLYVARGVLYARYVRETHRFPTLDFPRFLEEVADEEWVDGEFLERTLELVERKRTGEGAADVGRLFAPEEIRLPAIDPAVHGRDGVDRTRLNAFIREALEGVASGQ
ncbi:DNA polymerase beta superfamily protein [Natrononativus amylolyticus]|uniref:DNA polymerase beta superfamily protein n=1 Tax=Natrononativus amylolyticus TaxID=2963434 RepID=UPI0020CD55AD|nr:nucleotidyltransferase domain-containing protein [Natrononativus amylolyticus]